VLETTPYGPVVLVPVERRNATSAPLGAQRQGASRNALCVYYPTGGRPVPTAALCFSTQQLLSHRAYLGSLGHVFGLMPDGVRSVRITDGGAPTTALVRSNFFDVTARHAAPTRSSLPAAPPIPSVSASPASG
jgi:hypothetical protein